MKFSAALTALTLVGFGSMPLHAQHSQNPDASYMRFEINHWVFAPVTDDVRLLGFLAWFEDGEVTGSNIAIIWYQRENDDTWTTWGWDGDDMGAAGAWVRLHVGDESALSLELDVDGEADFSGPEGAVPPTQMANGLFLDDPAQIWIAESPDPEADMETLVAIGWPAAPSMSALEVSDPAVCDDQSVQQVEFLLDDLASDVETAYFGQTTIGQACVWPCRCTTTFGTPTCGAWIFEFSVPQSGGGLVCHYHRSCSRTYTKTGRRWYCLGCGSSGTQNYTEHGRTNALPGDPCSPPDP